MTGEPIKAYIDIDGVLLRNGKYGPEVISRFCRVLGFLRAYPVLSKD